MPDIVNRPLINFFVFAQSATWWAIPAAASSVAGGCAVRPGCAYTLRLLAHPWDGHTAANLRIQLDGELLQLDGKRLQLRGTYGLYLLHASSTPLWRLTAASLRLDGKLLQMGGILLRAVINI